MRIPLLSRGFLPRELPPPFGSELLGSVYGHHPLPPAILAAKSEQSSPVTHNLPRGGLLRRPLSIPDPIRYMLLVDEIASGWASLLALMNRSALSLSRPRRDHTGHRAFVFRLGFSRQPVFRARVRSAARYIFSADINQFYPSLYTHALAWACHGKPFAKANRGPAHLGNRLDKCVRNGQDGQTMGIPIGPDTSFLLAEALLGSFDADLVAQLRNRPGWRSMDEYEFSFSTYSAAEEGIAILQELLSEFELSLNPRKTGIHECPLPLNPEWVTKLQAVALPDARRAPRRIIVTFIDRAFETAHRYPGEAVMNWTISRLMSLDFSFEQWQIVEPLVLQAAVSEPGALPRCLRLILIAQKNGLKIDTTRLREALSVTLQKAVRRGHGSEASWAVWGHILFNLPLDAADVAALSGTQEDIVALVSLDARSRGLIPPATLFPNWQNALTSGGLQDGHWLLAFEAIIKRWLVPSGANPIATNPAYAHLAANNISFYSVGNPASQTLAHEHSAPIWLTPTQTYLL